MLTIASLSAWIDRAETSGVQIRGRTIETLHATIWGDDGVCLVIHPREDIITGIRRAETGEPNVLNCRITQDELERIVATDSPVDGLLWQYEDEEFPE